MHFPCIKATCKVYIMEGVFKIYNVLFDVSQFNAQKCQVSVCRRANINGLSAVYMDLLKELSRQPTFGWLKRLASSSFYLQSRRIMGGIAAMKVRAPILGG